MKEMITKDEMSWNLNNSPNTYHKKYIKANKEKIHVDIGA